MFSIASYLCYSYVAKLEVLLLQNMGVLMY
jgi:hypothetical protein